MSMDDNIQLVFYSQNNLDNTFTLVAEEITRRTNKDISKNESYKTSFTQMAKLVYDKVPVIDRNLMKCNSLLIDKSVLFFHNKIFDKTVKQTNTNTNTNINTNMHARQQSISKPDKMLQTINTTTQPPTQQHYNIMPFNLSDDFSASLISSDTTDIPLYQNIDNLQKMNNINPMSILEDYTNQRNQQTQQNRLQTAPGFEKFKEQTTSIHNNNNNNNNNNNLVSPRDIDNIKNTQHDNTYINPLDLSNLGNELSNRLSKRIDMNIINNNKANPKANNDKKKANKYNDNKDTGNKDTDNKDTGTGNKDTDNNNDDDDEEETLSNTQAKLVKMQRDTQPKYIEKVHYININSVDRDWTNNNSESRYKFQVKFNQNSDYQGSATIAHMYRNVVSVELVSAILPMDTHIEPFDTRIYMGLARYPYLLLRIDELDNVFRGTNNWVDKAFSTLLFDKAFHTNTLSTDYIATAGIINSSPKTSFQNEYMRGFMKYNPAYFEKKKFYNNPLASLNRMSLSITDPRGNFVNKQKDVLNIAGIAYTDELGTINSAGFDLFTTKGWPRSLATTNKMIKIRTATYFSNRLFRIGDRIIIKNITFQAGAVGVDNSRFLAFINRDGGHVIINLDIEDTTNKSYIRQLYISPPGEMDDNNDTVVAGSFYDETTIDLANIDYTSARLIDIDMQTQLLFRIVTRDPDTSTTLQPINVY